MGREMERVSPKIWVLVLYGLFTLVPFNWSSFFVVGIINIHYSVIFILFYFYILVLNDVSISDVL